MKKKRLERAFKQLMIFVQILALSLYAQNAATALAPPDSSFSGTQIETQHVFLSTAPIETNIGTTHIEVLAIEINNEQDLLRAREQLLNTTKKNAITNELFVLDVRAFEKDQSNRAVSSITTSAQKVLFELENSVVAQSKIKSKPTAR